MAMGDITVGSTIKITPTIKREDGTALDVSSASVLQIIIQKPDGERLVKTATPVSGGTDGVITATVTNTENDQIGNWDYLGYAVVPGGTYYSDIGSFEVKRGL